VCSWLAAAAIARATATHAVPPTNIGGRKAFDAASDAWERGDYIAALNGYTGLLNAPDGDAFFEPIALRTGELFKTHELTADGRAGRFSPDGKLLVYETGLEVSRGTRILRNDATRALVTELPGVSATFSADSTKVAYLKIPLNTDITAAADAIARAALTASNRTFLTQTLTWLIARDATIAIRDLTTQRETDLAVSGLMKTGLAFAPDGRTLYFLGGTEGDQTRTDIYAIHDGIGPPAIVADADGLKSVPVVAAPGAALTYIVPVQPPFRRPTPPQPAGQTPPGGAQPTTFGIVDLAKGRVSVIAGTAPTLSADGKTIAYVNRSGAESSSLMLGPVTGTHGAIRKIAARLDAPALSTDGSRVAYQRMDRDDWEIYVAQRDGSDEQRITRDIQHNLLPRFVDATHLLSVIGEPRHRRSFLYDLAAPAGVSQTRLFHNNTVRTIAPEYQWAIAPDGASIIVGAERDGNTVSPERGVYLVDLREKVTKADVLARLQANLKSETALKASGTRAFQPIAAAVRGVLSAVSVPRIYSYEKALFDFDSKHITRPGNRKAAEYLFATYQSFGYTPEYQWFEPPALRALPDTRTANVIATLRGTVNPELVYVVSSHFDSVVAGPGADDDTSGTAALLEAARVMAGHPMPATIVFASFTGEEGGLLGSREFVRRSLENKVKVVGGLNNDMVGWTNDQRLDNTIRYSNPGIRDIQHGAAMLFTRLITYDALYFKGTDAASYFDTYGDIVGGIGSYPVLSSPHYHQATDVLDNENHELIAETSKTTIATLMLLASSPSRLTNLKVDSVTGTVASLSWTPSPEKGVTSYLVAYGPPSNPQQHRITVAAAHAMLPQVTAGTVIAVKAVNARGMEGWDWARITIASPDVRPSL
jgi:Tol biopolymer transport system component